MASAILTPDIIAKESLMQLDNNLIAAKNVYRGYEGEFGESKIGDTITIRKPVKYALRSGPVIATQDATEGSVQITVDTQEGVDLRFRSKDLTLSIDKFADRYLKHPMIALANKVDSDILGLYKNVWNWVNQGSTFVAGKKIGSYADVAVAPERLMEMSCPDPLVGCLSPKDQFGLAGSFVSQTVYAPDLVKPAIERNKIPMVGNVDFYATQNVVTHTRGTAAGSGVVSSTTSQQNLSVLYKDVKDTNQQTILTTGWTGSTTFKKGDVITIDAVFAVNNVTKQTLDFLQQFVIVSDVTADASSGNDTTLTISPAIIPGSGGYQNVSAAAVAGATITVIGTAGAKYPQNMVFNDNAFALVMVPMELPEGAVKKARQSYKGFSIRVISGYDLTNDISTWRLDILYGVKAMYPDLATRLSGST